MGMELTMCAHMFKSSHHPHMWETHILLVVCREAVSMSGVAQCQSSNPKCIPIQFTLCVLMF